MGGGQRGSPQPKSRFWGLACDQARTRGAGRASAKDAYVLALETVEEPLLEQRARIAAEMEAARGALEESDFKDSSITDRSSKSGGATGRALPSEDRANYGIKRPSSEMEEHKRKRFRRRLMKVH